MNDQESFRTLQLMTELEDGKSVSQRELASRLGIAVGLVNSCLKNFVSKGYIRVKNYPRNRYAYLLTPKGLAEKSRLAYQHISYFTGLYTHTRKNYLELFSTLAEVGVSEVVFAGVDEVAEIAYLSLQEGGLTLSGVYDQERVGESFLGYTIQSIEHISGQVVISSLKRRQELFQTLLNIGLPVGEIHLPESDAL